MFEPEERNENRPRIICQNLMTFAGISFFEKIRYLFFYVEHAWRPFHPHPQACYKMVVRIFAGYNLLIYAIFYCEMDYIQLLLSLCNALMGI